VAKRIFASKIPVISAVGHETDFTISDFVADKRAETPTAAAQMAVPDIASLKEYVKNQGLYLNNRMESTIKYMELRVRSHNIESLHMSTRNRIQISLLKTDSLIKDMNNLMIQKYSEYNRQIEKLKSSLEALNPVNIMERGYAAILDDQGVFTGSSERFQVGDSLTAVFKDGSINCKVNEIRRDNNVKSEQHKL